MRRRTVGIALLMFLGLGIALAYGQRARRVGRPHRFGPGRLSVTEPLPPGSPTGEEVRARIRREFLALRTEPTQVEGSQVHGLDRDFDPRIAAAFRAQDAAPPERLAHFAWLRQNPDIRHRGWTGAVVAIDPVEGGRRLTVRIAPRIDLMSVGQRVVTGDGILETYDFDGRTLRYVGSAPDPQASRESLIID